MNKLTLIFGFAALLFFAACDCRRVDCFGNGILSFDLISKTDSTTNLIGSGQFLSNQLKLDLLLKNSGLPSPQTRIVEAGKFTNIQVDADINLNGIIIQLAGFEPDTLFISASEVTVEGRCCGGTFILFNSVMHNGIERSDGRNAILSLYK